MAEKHITEMLARVRQGDSDAERRLVEVVYADLHRLASRRLSHEHKGHMLQTTALVNETYLKLFGSSEPLKINDTVHFFAVAAIQMRRILIDHARASVTSKRQGKMVDLEEACFVSTERPDDLLALDDALKELEDTDEDAAKVVELRFFGGYTNDETAAILGTNVARVRRDWDYARAWLYHRLAVT